MKTARLIRQYTVENLNGDTVYRDVYELNPPYNGNKAVEVSFVDDLEPTTTVFGVGSGRFTDYLEGDHRNTIIAKLGYTIVTE